ncbi:hypothetical protein V8E53_004038 [Lactarius tabidus]
MRTAPSNAILAAIDMSQISPTPSSSSNLQAIFEKKTKEDILAHPSMAQFQTSTEILAVLRTQVQQFEKSTSGDDKWTKSLNTTANDPYTLSSVIGARVGLVFSPTSVIFAGASVLLSVAIVFDLPFSGVEGATASQDSLIDIFEGRYRERCMERQVPPVLPYGTSVIPFDKYGAMKHHALDYSVLCSDLWCSVIAAALRPTPTHSNYLTRNSVASPTKVTGVIPEGYVIRQKSSIILTRQQEP